MVASDDSGSAVTGAVIAIFLDTGSAVTGAVIAIFELAFKSLTWLLPKMKSAINLNPLLEASSISPSTKVSAIKMGAYLRISNEPSAWMTSYLGSSIAMACSVNKRTSDKPT